MHWHIGTEPLGSAMIPAFILCSVLAIGMERMNRFDSEHDNRGRSALSCRLEQEWQTGDVYNWEWLTFERRGRGSWMQGDRHGEEQNIAFRWRANGATLTLTTEHEERSVRFEIEKHGNGCTLRFDRSPVSNASTEFDGAD